MPRLYNLARMSSATVGTGTITLGSAVSGYLTFALAGVQDGDVVTYGIKDGANSEVGYGKYTASGTTLTRNPVTSTNSNAAINLSGSEEVYVTAQSADFPFPDNWITGLTLSNDGVSPNTVIDIAAGVAADSTNVELMRLTSAITKTTGSWAVGSGNGGLDTGSVAINTWYHVWLIRRPDTGVVDALISTSASAPTMPTNYTQKRRIGSIKTASGTTNILAFTQTGDTFSWAAPVVEGGGVVTVGTSRVTQALVGVPTGVIVNAICYGLILDNGVSNVFWLGPVSATDAAPSTSTSPHFFIDTVANTVMNWGMVSIPTNTSAQIAMRATAASNSVRLSSQAWVDTRGR